jgi:hypothetical protein
MIDIDSLTQAQLFDLNNRIVARLKFLQHMQAHASMLDFSLGERVAFQPPGHPLLHAVITKYNRKTVTVITDEGRQWTVAPDFLRKVLTPDGSHTAPHAASNHGAAASAGALR